MRPEQLNRVALTDAVVVLWNMCLVRTNDNMVEMTAVAVIYDRIFCERNTMPFTLPFAAELT